MTTQNGFANAQGGTLIIGRNDAGDTVGVASQANKLLEDIPNKVRDTLGIMVVVRLVMEHGYFAQKSNAGEMGRNFRIVQRSL